MIGGSLFYDFARVGATPAPFQSFVLSAGVVTDYVYGAGIHWQGGCGGFPCDGSGSLNEWNLIGELKAATPLGGGNALNGHIGAGAAIFWPSGHPTGGTTSFLGARPRRPCALGGAWIISLISIGRLASRSAFSTRAAQSSRPPASASASTTRTRSSSG